MKAIVIAAGRGKRMGALTQDLPKCLAISWEGKSLFERQSAVLRQAGISDLVVVRGYQGNRFPADGARYYWNHEYEKGNILDSLMCAGQELEGEVLVTYSDIGYSLKVVQTMLRSQADISIAVDLSWKDQYHGRTDNPLSEAEGVLFDERKQVLKIGKIVNTQPAVQGEFIGMMKLRRAGSEVFKEYFERAKEKFSGKPFQRAASFRQAYLTDMLQFLTDSGVAVHCETISGGWQEIDTPQDFQKWTRTVSAQEE